VYHGFILNEVRWVEEIHSTAHLFRHEKSGARLLHLGNDDDNKVFSISFRTPPADSTGVPHIIEHSVLCGSRKFPVKEPFVELVKGSLNTFLNAMTYPDKTMYPVASRNRRDFRNLMDVYLDAVFYPNIYQQPEVLMQEGWHYELENRDSEITYKGVVYNEMKGVFSSADSILEQQVYESLFPDTAYGKESGGDPDIIPQLSQEAFLDFHRRYYHPANSYLFLYGDMDLLTELQFINEEYLVDFTEITTDSVVKPQTPFAKTVVRAVEYPVSPEEKLAGKTFYSLNFVLGRSTDPELCLAFAVLEHLLLETPAAPLKRALLDAGLGKEVFSEFTRCLLQPVLRVGVAGAESDRHEEFVQVVYQTLQKLVAEGIDKRLLESSLNLCEFTLREANFGSHPKGLIYNIKCMDSWLYDGDPLLHLEYETVLAKVKAGLNSRYFEQLIEKYLMDNTHRSLVVARPRAGLSEAKAAKVRAELEQYKAGLAPVELDALIEQTKRLKIRQETPDNPEQLAVIPLLDIADIGKNAETHPLMERREVDVPVLHHALFTNRIVYLNLYFDTRSVPQPLLPYLFLLPELLGKMDTVGYGYADLSTEINLHTGGFSFDAAAFSAATDDCQYQPKLRVKAKALIAKLPAMLNLMGEITGRCRFDNTQRLSELVREVKSSWDNNLFRRGQQVAAARALGYCSPAVRYNETGLLSFHQFISGLERDWNTRGEEAARCLKTVADLVFRQANLLVSVTLDDESYVLFQQQFPRLCDALGKQPAAAAVEYTFPLTADNEGLLTSGKVQYVARAANYRRLGYPYHGSLKILETIMRYDYLWNRIRVQGGAYGAFSQFDRNGNMVFCSYRDPNLRETVAVYDETAAYLDSFSADRREMTKYIIGTISHLDMPLTPPQRGERAAEWYIRGLSAADVQQERDQILAAGPEDIRKTAALVRAAMAENYLCVLGSEEKIRENETLFKTLVKVIE
ncbi:MAG TPA: insulinase family protein, partial [Patescibacteria group bacterium]|nr:insulinase family protein [Patescibacteria group bacterium]